MCKRDKHAWVFVDCNTFFFVSVTFIVCHSHVGISQFALVHAVVHVHVRRTGGEYFRTNLLYQSLLTLLVDFVYFCRTLELK